MTVQPILLYPDKKLREKAIPVEDVNTEEVQILINDMLDTIEAYDAQGLAATQIGKPLRVIVCKIRPAVVVNDKKQYSVFINPEIIDKSGNVVAQEGCLSFPTLYDRVGRSNEINLKATDYMGNVNYYHFSGVDAVAVQHEIDHLDGVLFTDKMNRIQRRIIEKKAEKNKKKIYGSIV